VGKYRGEAVPLGIGRDDRDHLRSVLEPGLSCDVLVISGGVSAGVLDLVPSVLNGLGVRELFHKINLKPGKPLWFGVREATANAAGCLVFGLPGNPVSAFVCFELFVRPALSRLSGLEHADWEPRSAVLGQEWTYRGGRFTLHPAAVHEDGGRLVATPLAWKGSGDLFGLSRADALIRFSGQARTFRPGEQVLVHLLD
jgi:molybdopterin molybdotransferase